MLRSNPANAQAHQLVWKFDESWTSVNGRKSQMKQLGHGWMSNQKIGWCSTTLFYSLKGERRNAASPKVRSGSRKIASVPLSPVMSNRANNIKSAKPSRRITSRRTSSTVGIKTGKSAKERMRRSNKLWMGE